MEYSWIGEPHNGVPAVGKKRVAMFDAVKLQKRRAGETIYKIFAAGDFVHLRSPRKGLPYVGRIINLWEKADGVKMVTVQWLYRLTDIPENSRVHDVKFRPSEILLTDHFDNNEVGSILDTVRIRFKCHTRSSVRSVISQLFTDDIDDAYGWGDPLLPPCEPLSQNTKCEYECSKKFLVSKDVLKGLSETDLDKVCEQLFSDNAKTSAITLSAPRILQLARSAQANIHVEPAKLANAQKHPIFDAVDLDKVSAEVAAPPMATPHVRKGDTVVVHQIPQSVMNPSEGIAVIQETPTAHSPNSKRLKLSSTVSTKRSTSYHQGEDAPEPETPLWGCLIQ